jgi:2-dehydropantoate 2-reductase
MERWKPHVTVVGAGGMGALFGAILQEGGLEVALVDIDAAHVGAINRDGLKIEGFGGDRSVQIPATTDHTSINRTDVMLFQCKGYSTREAARSVRHLADGGAVAISFQNGLGNEEVLMEELGDHSVLGGNTAMAGYLLAPGRIRDFSRVPSYIGEMAGGLSARAERIAGAFTAAGLETLASENVVQTIWKKLLGNIAMSAVSGITDLTGAAALAVPALRETSERALREAHAVAAALGVELDLDDAIRGMEFISTPGGTGDNKSSLCVDLLNRRQTEVDFIYGTVIARADERGVPVPTLKTLASLVKGLESKYMGETA